jgi:hypothetical protein
MNGVSADYVRDGPWNIGANPPGVMKTQRAKNNGEETWSGNGDNPLPKPKGAPAL